MIYLKKLILFIFGISLIFVNITNVFADTLTLNQIVEQLNSSNYGIHFIEDGYGYTDEAVMNIEATVIDDTIKVSGILGTISEPDLSQANMTWLLNDDVLSINLNLTEGFDPEDLDQLIPALLNFELKACMLLAVIDSVGQLKGYAKGELLEIISQSQAENYTLASDGIELSQSNENVIKVLIDLSRVFELKLNKPIINTPVTPDTIINIPQTPKALAATTTTTNAPAVSTNPKTGPVQANSSLVSCGLLLFSSVYFIVNKKNKFVNFS